MVPEPAARLHMLQFVESEMISSRNHVVMLSKSRLARCLDTTVHTKLRKLCTAEDADSRCGHSVRHDKAIDILPIA